MVAESIVQTTNSPVMQLVEQNLPEANKCVLEFVRLTEKASAPFLGSEKAAGADLCSAEDCLIPAGERRLVGTGLQLAIPEGHYGRVAPRSGLAVKHEIDVGAGVVDADYHGELKVKVGDRIVQLIYERISHPVLREVQEISETNGFGSTGVNNQQQ
ncbi:deoxyuridine 5'-triphosphate nucleotidohydrolase [Aphelenchoides avenae]|nr:deoxyuridine 5'-triphosphate nucleotidohydrolase [Aphelenchus avenae]